VFVSARFFVGSSEFCSDTMFAETGKVHDLLVWLISHQPAVLFSQNKPATSNHPTVLFSQNKSAPAKQTGCMFAYQFGGAVYESSTILVKVLINDKMNTYNKRSIV
jgi:hypothetical protein